MPFFIHQLASHLNVQPVRPAFTEFPLCKPRLGHCGQKSQGESVGHCWAGGGGVGTLGFHSLSRFVRLTTCGGGIHSQFSDKAPGAQRGLGASPRVPSHQGSKPIPTLLILPSMPLPRARASRRQTKTHIASILSTCRSSHRPRHTSHFHAGQGYTLVCPGHLFVLCLLANAEQGRQGGQKGT